MKKKTASLFAVLLAIAMLAGSVIPVYAQSAEPPQSVSITEETEPPSDPIATEEPEAETPPEETEPPVEEPEPSGEETEPQPEGDEGFVPLEIVSFTSEVEAALGREAELAVELNRDDVAVEYQWQADRPTEAEPEAELLFDYTFWDDPSYWFPFADISEAELLEVNPDAVWPGVEMYLEAVEEADGDTAAVTIEEGTPNYVVEEALAEGESISAFSFDLPDWQDIEGANGSAYAFTVDETSAEAGYRCVVTIVDEAYLAEAAEHAGDVYGDTFVASLPVEEEPEGETKETAEEETPAEDFVPEAEDTLVTETAAVLLDEPVTMAALNGPIGNVQYSDGWIIGLDKGMEYITADGLSAHPEASNANNGYWTYLGTGAANRMRPNSTSYLQAGLTADGKLPALSAWYGKTVYFRYKGQDISQAVPISIPAFSGIDYTTGEKVLYKKSVSVLNVFVADTPYDFYDSVLMGVRGANSSLSGAEDNSIVTTSHPLNPQYGTNLYAGISFNEHADDYLRDAEGNYRYDSVLVGTNVGAERDLSGAAAWALRDYISEGYGFITGHDMMYAYGGVTSADYEPGKTDTRTPLYHINTKTDGHWNMNWLMGVNKHYTDASPYEARSMVLCFGDYTDKSTLYGERDNMEVSTIRIATHTGAAQQERDRNPTNYPYNNSNSGVAFYEGAQVYSHSTHSNQQIAYGTVWIDFVPNSGSVSGMGRLVEDQRDGLYGTNNFYLTTNGNLALDQIGHIVTANDIPGRPTVFFDEARLLANTVMYVSQRQQCQVCQSEQGDSDKLHFVHRIYDAEDLAKIGHPDHWYTFPLDGCYILADNITLPESWIPIENFRGHFHADNFDSKNGALQNYRITLNSSGTPLFATGTGAAGGYDNADNGAGWNLGADDTVGHGTIVNSEGSRATGVARVSGQLHALLGGKPTDWASHIVVVEGTDGQDYWCKTNNEGKYVISNLPCTGVMNAFVYKTDSYANISDANGIAQNGTMRVNVLPDFWKTNDTTALYFIGFSVNPISDKSVKDGKDAEFEATAKYEKEITDFTWWVQLKDTDQWVNLSNPYPNTDMPFEYEITGREYTAADGETITATKLKILNACIDFSGLNVKVIFDTGEGKSGDTFDVRTGENTGLLTVTHWPLTVTNPQSIEVWADGTATFESTVTTRVGVDDGLTVKWQMRAWEADEWVDIADIDVLNNSVTSYTVENVSGAPGPEEETRVTTTSTLTITNTPVFPDPAKPGDFMGNMWVRAVYTYNYQGSHAGHEGSSEATGDKEALLTVKEPKLFVNWVDDQPERKGMTFDNALLCATESEYSQESAVYEADVYYMAGADETSEGTPDVDVLWHYKTADIVDTAAWNQEAANALAARLGVNAPSVTIETGAPERQVGGFADGYYKIHTKMTITNVHWKFYSDYCFISFAPGAESHYKTNPYELIDAKTSRVPLVVRYAVDVFWNGGTQEQHGTYSEWRYLDAEIKSAPGVKTLLIEFNALDGVPHDSRDKISYTGSLPGTMRLDGSSNDHYMLLVSDTPVETSLVEEFLSQQVFITVYEQQDDPKVWVYINAERNLGTTLSGRAITTFMEGFAALGGISPMYAETINISWSASRYFVGGSAVLHANRTDAGYYQWQMDKGAGWEVLSTRNAPTYAFGQLTPDMANAKIRLMYGDSEDDPGLTPSNILTMAFEFNNVLASSATSTASIGNIVKNYAYGPYINIPAEYASRVTQVSFRYRAYSNKNPNGDISVGVDDGSGNRLFSLGVGSSTNTGYITYTVTIPTGRGLTSLRPWVYNNAGWVVYDTNMYIDQVRIWGTGDFAVGSELIMKRGQYDAWDLTSVNQIDVPNVLATASSKDKVYDGEEGMADIQLVDRSAILTDQQLAAILARGTVQYSSGATTAGNAASGSECIDVGTYEAIFIPAQEDAMYFAYNNAVDMDARQTDFKITPRKLHLYSEGNDKQYDGTPDAVIANVQFNLFDPNTNTGLVASDAGEVSVSPESYAGRYRTNNNKDQIDQTGGIQATIVRTQDPITLVGSRAHNYTIGNEVYKGEIKPRELHLHSLYMDEGDNPDDPKNPRNVKEYDGTTNAFISDIILDAIIDGDDVQVNSDKIAGQYPTADAGDNDGDGYPITRTGEIWLVGDDAENYVIASEDYSGAITRKELEVEIGYRKVVYGDGYTLDYTTAGTYSKDETGEFTTDLTIATLVENDTLIIDSNKSRFAFKDITGITTTTPVNNYEVVYEGLDETNYPVLKNYRIEYTPNYVMVTSRPVTVTVNGGYEKLYGDPNPEFDAVYDGFVNGDTAETALEGTLTYRTSVDENTEVLYVLKDGELVVGSYPVEIPGKNSTLKCKKNKFGYENYHLEYVDGDITVLPREITITAQPKEKIYGDPDPEPEYIIEGGVIKAGELEDLVITREPGEDVGQYQYLFDPGQLGDADAGNYSITYVPDYLTIVPAELVIRANDARRPLKTPNPEFSVEYIGFKFADDESDLQGTLDIRTTATLGSPVGEYPITPSGLTSSNYTIIYEDGTLTIYDGAGLSITKSVDRETAVLGEEIAYTLVVTNDGERILENVRVEDGMTGHTGEIDPVPSGAYTYNGSGVFTILRLDVGETVSIRYTYTVRNTDPTGAVIKNTATATEPDSELDWSSEEVAVRVNTRRTLSITKEADLEAAERDVPVHYTITVKNTGNVPMEGITVEDVMTDNTSAVEVVEKADYTWVKLPGSETMVFTLRTLQPGETVVIEYTFTFNKADANKKLEIENTATATLPADGDYPKVEVSDSAKVTGISGNIVDTEFEDFMEWLDYRGVNEGNAVQNDEWIKGCVYRHDGVVYFNYTQNSLGHWNIPQGNQFTVENVTQFIKSHSYYIYPVLLNEDGSIRVVTGWDALNQHRKDRGIIWQHPDTDELYVCMGDDNTKWGDSPNDNYILITSITSW